MLVEIMAGLVSVVTVAWLTGLALLTIGFWMIYQPLAFVVPGGLLVSAAVAGALSSMKGRPR